MTNQTVQLSKVYLLINKLLNKLLRRKFGKQYSVRLNSFCFIANRTNVCYSDSCTEQITIISFKPIQMDKLILIKEFLLFNINSVLLCINSVGYIEVVEINLVIV